MIVLEEISVQFGETTLLNGLSLEIGQGERLVIVGASGSGKTTLLRLIAGFVAPARGRLFIGNSMVSAEGKILIPPYERELGMVFQDLALWPHMNAGENIAFGLKLKGVPKKERRQRVAEMLVLVGLEGYSDKDIDQLSGGEKQRIALARSLVLSPKVLLMDEPLSSLDPELNRRLRGEIVRLQKELGFTLIYVTHNEREAEEIATRTIRL